MSIRKLTADMTADELRVERIFTLARLEDEEDLGDATPSKPKAPNTPTQS